MPSSPDISVALMVFLVGSGIDGLSDLRDARRELGVGSNLISYLVVGMEDGRMIAVAERAADRWK
jgi:hypothetical protein